jgi:hypothetical protein
MADADERILEQLRDDFPGCHFWRALQRDGTLGSWMASRRDPSAGTDPTLMEATPALLRKQCEEQRANAGKRLRVLAGPAF